MKVYSWCDQTLMDNWSYPASGRERGKLPPSLAWELFPTNLLSVSLPSQGSPVVAGRSKISEKHSWVFSDSASGASQWRFTVKLQNTKAAQRSFTVELHSGDSQKRFTLMLHSEASEWSFTVEIHTEAAQWSFTLERFSDDALLRKFRSLVHRWIVKPFNWRLQLPPINWTLYNEATCFASEPGWEEDVSDHLPIYVP